MFQSHHQWFLPPTIGIRAPFIGKQKSFGVYPNFQSCQKQVLIIPQCRSHQDELTAARISLIGDRGEPHAPPEDSAQTPTRSHAPRGRRRLSHTRAIFEPFKPPKPSRGPASRAASRAVHEPSRAASSRQRAEGIFPGIFREYSPEYSRFNPANRPRTELVFGPVHPFCDPISRK